MVELINEKMKELRKKVLIKNFEEKGETETLAYREDLENGNCRFIYGCAVGDDKGKLQGFNLEAYDKYYDDFGSCGSSKPYPYCVSEGKSFLSVDEYVEFIDKIAGKDGRAGVILAENSLAEEAIDNIISEGCKLADIRKKIARTTDKILGTNTESKNVRKKVALVEKIISDAVLGKKRE